MKYIYTGKSVNTAKAIATKCYIILYYDTNIMHNMFQLKYKTIVTL